MMEKTMTDDKHFFSDKPFEFGSGELLIIKATDAIRAVTGPNMQKISDSNVSKL